MTPAERSILFVPPARPPERAFDVTTTLADFAIITYAVNPRRLAALLPAGFTPETRTLADGRTVAFVSAVPFRDLDFHFGFAPWLRFAFAQTNYRAYVRRGEQRCAWFFGTTLASRWVYWPRWVWQLPWHPARTALAARWDGARCSRYQLRSHAAWGAAESVLEGTDEPSGTLDGFASDDDTALTLTHPLVGYYRRRDGHVGTYDIWHDRLHMRRARALSARFAVFEDLGLVEAAQTPHSVLVQRETGFVIRLPPTRAPEAPLARTGPGSSSLNGPS